MVKKLDLEILTYLYVLRATEFFYAIFAVMYVCVCVGGWVDVGGWMGGYVSEHDSV